MINNERLKDLQCEKEATRLNIQAEKERQEIAELFKEFMESAFWNIPLIIDKDENNQFTRADMFLAFMYGLREGRK